VKKQVFLALMMALLVTLTSGCKLIVKDPEVDKQTVVLDVNGKTGGFNLQIAFSTAQCAGMAAAEEVFQK